MYRAVDVMGFAGAFTLGAVQSGFELVGKRELVNFGVENCAANRHLLGDNWDVEIGGWESWTPANVEWVFGNPPCSGFSVMTAKEHRGVDAKVNACMWAMSNYAARCRPVIVVMESVRQAYKMGHELMLALRDNIERQTGLRYGLYHVLQDAHDLGGAARRPRYFMVLSQVPFGVEYPRVLKPVLRDVIGDLEGLTQTWLPQPYRRPPSWWSKELRSDSGAVDGHVSADNLGIKRALALYDADPKSWPQGAHLAQVAQRVYETYGKLPEPLWTDTHVEKIVAKMNRLVTEGKLKRPDWQMGFTTMTRWRYDEPGRVITGAALGAVMHPTQRRTITYREAARVMGFPDDWRIMSSRNSSGLSQWWGKGITVQCGEWIGTWVRRSLDGTPGDNRGEPMGEREWLIEDRPAKTIRRRIELVASPIHRAEGEDYLDRGVRAGAGR